MARKSVLKAGGAKFCSHTCAGKANAARTIGPGMLPKRGTPDSTKSQRIKAKTRIKTLVNQGILKRPACCEKCGEKRPVDGHHPDYQFPEQVIWLCRSCHHKEHYRLGTPKQ